MPPRPQRAGFSHLFGGRRFGGLGITISARPGSFATAGGTRGLRLGEVIGWFGEISRACNCGSMGVTRGAAAG
ncbi:hypothetical protein [Elstera litoralis]|uniref:hypothetical protein n=1 Tax=Elstera litoralis TaxID=552518 RepID=UPI0012EE3272|nr:hypothetical protein [Elstera litoralis]